MTEVTFKRGHFYKLRGFPPNRGITMPGVSGYTTSMWHTDSSYLCIRESEGESSAAWLWTPDLRAGGRRRVLKLNIRELADSDLEFEDVSYKGLRIGATVYARAKTIWGPLAASQCHERALLARPGDPLLYIVGFDREGARLAVICSDDEDATGGDYFSVEDLVPRQAWEPDPSTTLPPGVHLDYTPGKRYYVSDFSEDCAREGMISRIYVASVGTSHIFVEQGEEYKYGRGDPFQSSAWKYIVDIPERTAMTLKEAEALLKKHDLIRGDLVIKE